jgi:hypothetical protein
VTYRDDRNALQARHDALDKELSDLRTRIRELDSFEERRRALEAELRAVDGLLAQMGDGTATRSLLDQTKVASPCSASWERMTGDDRVRFCGECSKNVYNLSAMTREEAEALINANRAGELCIRLYTRQDGTVLTADCPVGVTRKRRRQLAIAVAASGGFMAALAASVSATVVRPTMGAMAPPPRAYAPPPPEPMALTRVTVVANPPDAILTVDGVRLSSNPGIARFVRDGQVHRVEAQAPGYRPMWRDLVYDEEELSLQLELAREPKRPTSR